MKTTYNIAYHYPSLDHIYAQRTIWQGYKDAFEQQGHQFFTFTNTDHLESFLDRHEIDIFMTASHDYYQKVLDLDVLQRRRKQGMKVVVKLDRWNSPFGSQQSWREGLPLSKDTKKIQQIKDGMVGDLFYSVFADNDWRMQGFEQSTGQRYHCIPLACNPLQQYYEYDTHFAHQISFLGSWSANKADDFKNLLYPLAEHYDLKLYGQDWSHKERILGKFQRLGQYLNIGFLSKLQKAKLGLHDERKIYSSSDINLNIHEQQQKQYGGDCNERTFKILACGGFQIVDDVACIRDYFEDGKEIVIAKNRDDRYDKIAYYSSNPSARRSIIEAGQKKARDEQSYSKRIDYLFSVLNVDA